MTRIRDVFRSLDGRGALVAYAMGGDPDLETSGLVIESLVRGGADIVEVGIPFSDPIADGKSIQAASVRSLDTGTKPADVLRLVSAIRESHDVPIAIMTYYNVLYSLGLNRFLDDARRAGVDGLIVPDLPLDETEAYSKLARIRGIDTIMLAAPTTKPARLKSLVSRSSGFLYLVSLLGVTGARRALARETLGLVASTKSHTAGRIPLAVGFGISRPEHVRSVLEAGADAVIVGSSIVDRVASGRPQHDMLRDVERYVRSLRAATETVRPNQT